MESVNIVLLGKTGHGKSSTGNTLLGQEVFLEGSSPNSTTRLIERREFQLDNFKFIIYDTPGTFETNYNVNRNDNRQDEKMLRESMDMLMRACSKDGINAFFFVYDIMMKYTPEEIRVTEMLEKVFGKDFLSTYGVLIFTHGDQFKEDFSLWLKIKQGPIGDLINKFGNRVYLITNQLTLHDDLQKERKIMIGVAKEMFEKGNVYSLEKQYKEAKISCLQLKIQELEADIQNQRRYSREVKRSLEVRVNVLIQQVNEESKEKEDLKQMKETLKRLKVQIKNMKSTCSVS